MAFENEKKSDGAFWKRKSQNGKEYYSGHVTINKEKTYLVMFPNTRKTRDNQPDFDIKISLSR